MPKQNENHGSQDRANLRYALLNLHRTVYEKIRVELIGRLGYDAFRELQNDIFKEIGTIKFEEQIRDREILVNAPTDRPFNDEEEAALERERLRERHE